MTREESNAYQREWAKNNRDKVNASKRRSYAKHGKRWQAQRDVRRAGWRDEKRAAKLAWEKANPELVSMQRARRRIKKMNAKINGGLKYHYDITLEKFNELLAQQGGVCAICKKLEITKRTRRLVVDHDHATGKVRGLLCHRCNCGIGYLKDDVALLEKAISYLRKHE